MENDVDVRKVAKDLMMYAWFKQDTRNKEPPLEKSLAPEIPGDFMNKLRASVCIEILYVSSRWKPFCKAHLVRMTASYWLFSAYVSYACYLQNEGVDDACEGFIRTLALVSYFGFYCLPGEFKYLLHMCPELFFTFYERELQTKFESQGSWTNLKAVLTKLSNLPPSPFEKVKSLKEFRKTRTVFPEIKMVDLGNVSQKKVESHEKAASFAHSIFGRLTEVDMITFDDVLVHYEQPNNEHPRKEAGEMSLFQQVADVRGMVEAELAKLYPQENKALGHVKCLAKPTSKEDSPKIPDSSRTENKLQDSGERDQKYDLKPPLTVKDQVQKLLKDITADIDKLSNLIKSACETVSPLSPRAT